MSSKSNEVREALRRIVEKEGVGCLKDARRFRSLWLDYVSQSKEARLILSAVQEGVGGVLLNAVDQDEAGQKRSIRRCEQLLSDASITEGGAQFAIREIASAMRIDVDRVYPPPAAGAAQPEADTQVSQAGQVSPPQSQEQPLGQERYPSQQHNVSSQREDHYHEFLAENAAKETSAKRKRKFPVLLLLLLVLGGAAAGMFLTRGNDTVSTAVPPVGVQDEDNNLNVVVPPVIPTENEEKPTQEPTENVTPAVVPPVVPMEPEPTPETEPIPEPVQEPLPYEIDTVVSNLSDFHSMVMDNENNLYYIDSGIVYNTKDDITLDLSDFDSHQKFSYLAHDPYNDIVYLLVGNYTFGISSGYDPAIYDITDLSAPVLVFDAQNDSTLSRVGLFRSEDIAPQIAVLDNGALLVPFKSENNNSSATCMINIAQQTAAFTGSMDLGSSYSHDKLLGDKVFHRVDSSSAEIWTFAAESTTKESVNLEYAIRSNAGNASAYSKYGVLYTYLNTIGVCCFNADGTANILIPAESIAVKDYQSMDHVSAFCVAVGAEDQVAFYDNFLHCIRLIRPASDVTE